MKNYIVELEQKDYVKFLVSAKNKKEAREFALESDGEEIFRDEISTRVTSVKEDDKNEMD